ncbi:putative DsbA family dithiol-disulfide isomerase [Microbacterium sp. SLBN-154]|nr:putative DsbA family dithiol-disulfide isomerase [Microbacterium sp. SLBN-154]
MVVVGMTEPLRLDVWSDIACPWCYIGKRNLEAGLAQTLADDDAPEVEIVYHSYELAPDTPPDYDGSEVDYLAERKGVSRDEAQQMIDRVTEVAKGSGLAYRYDLLHHANTGKAHRLLHFAKENGRQLELVERLMSAYFTEGRHIGTDDELVRLAGDAGLDADAAREVVATDRFKLEVRRDQAQAQAYGISGVPFYVIDGTYGVSGAQPPEAFAQILRQVWSERRTTAEAEPAASAG